MAAEETIRDIVDESRQIRWNTAMLALKWANEGKVPVCEAQRVLREFFSSVEEEEAILTGPINGRE